MEGESEKSGRAPLRGVSCDVKFTLRFRIPVLILFLAVTALFCLQLENIRLTPDPLGSMYPAGHPFLPSLEAIGEMAPEPRMLIVIVETKQGDIYNSETIQKIDNVTRALMKIDGVLPSEITSLTRGVTDYENTSEGLAMEPADLEKSFNTFLKDLNVTFRRDPENGRPRANKPDSVKDREQKEKGNYYYS